MRRGSPPGCGGLLRGDDDGAVHDLPELPAVSREGHRDGTALLGGLHCEDHVLGVAGGGHADDDVPLPADGLDLPLEDQIVAVIVPDGRDRRDVGQAHSGQRGALQHVPPGELGRDVLSVRGGAAVAHEDRLTAVAEAFDEDVRRSAYLGGVYLGNRLCAPLQFGFDRLIHSDTSMILRLPARTCNLRQWRPSTEGPSPRCTCGRICI